MENQDQNSYFYFSFDTSISRAIQAYLSLSFNCMLQQNVPSSGSAFKGSQKVSQKSQEYNASYGTGTGNAGSLAHASAYFNPAKYVGVHIYTV